jgi:hypothetical protein
MLNQNMFEQTGSYTFEVKVPLVRFVYGSNLLVQLGDLLLTR